MADSKDAPNVYNTTVLGEKSITILGDKNRINIIQQQEDGVDDFAKAFKILSEWSKLPAKPFHKCLTRKSEVDKMWSIYRGMECEDEQHITGIYLTGPPGSGKTQLSRQFAQRFLNDTPKCNDASPVVLTISVESIKAFIKSAKELLQETELLKMDIITNESDEITVAQLYMDLLRKLLKRYPGKWLLIFDNLFDAKDFDGIIPQPGSEEWGEGKIIVTTQNSDLAPACHAYAESYSLKIGLDKEDAVTVLTEISDVKEDEYTASVAREVEYFPLSLACAATYVGQMRRDRPSSNFSWKQFLELYQKHDGELKYRTFENFNVYPYSMALVAQLAASRLAEHSVILRQAFIFLSYCTISPVPLTIVSSFVQGSLRYKDDTKSDEIMAQISNCSLLSEASTSVECIKFHQVMGKAFVHLREEDIAKLQDTEKMQGYVSILHFLAESLEKAIPDYDRSSVSVKMLASQHLKSVVDYGKAQQWTECAEFVVILAFLADCLYHVPGVNEADRISYSEFAYKISQRLSKPMESIPYVRVLKTLGFYYRENKDLAKAVDLLKEALRLTEGKDSKEWTALKSSVLNVLAWTYKLQAKYDLAEETMKSSIELAKECFGDNHQEVIERLCNLAIIYRDMLNMSKAKETVDQAREIAESSLDKWHLTRAQAANFSAKIYLRYAEMTESAEKEALLNASLRLHADALSIYENVLGKDHIYVAGVCMTYGSAHVQLQQYETAHELVKRAEKIYQDVGHSQLSYALRYKTEVLLGLGKASEAEEVVKKSIEMDNSGRGRFLLSDVYLRQKRFPESKAVINEVLAQWKSGVLPPNHFWVKHAEKIKQQCDQEIFKMYMFMIVPLVALCIAISLAIWYIY